MKKSFVFSLCAAMTLLAACNESENWTPNTGCSDGELRCDSDKLYACKAGEWTLGANCADSGKVCGQNADKKPACVSGPKEECVPSCKDGVVTLCDSDGNAMTHKCTEGQVCGLNTQGTPGCVTIPQKSCMPYCKNNGIVTCDENMNEVFNECEDNKICEMDENYRPACVGMKSCMPSCVNGVLTSCDENMNESTKSCSDENKVCGVNENGVPACVDAAKSCMPLCVNDVLTTCDADMNEVTTSCSDENKVCGYNEFGVPACVDAAKSCMPSCVNGVLTTCDADMNEITKSCSDENKVCGYNEFGVPACVDAVVCAFDDVNLLVGDKACDTDGKVVECQESGVMSEGVACTEGVCTDGKCVRRDCDDVVDGKNICKENKLMVCDDGALIEDVDNACVDDMPLCRDGEFECSAYKDCDDIEHGKNGCKDGNIVSCNDGETSVVTDGNCVENEQFCIADDAAEGGFICKTPASTDCSWNGGLVAKNETVCDGNVLKTCSADKDGELSEGIDCATVNNGKPLCDPKLNICRDYFNCGDNDEIVHEAIVCNVKGTNKAKCNDGKLVDLTDDDACAAVDNANTICTYDIEATCGFECKTGYFQKNGACEPIVMCDAVKETYNVGDNTCSCNEEAFWTGTAGSCVCKDGYLEIGNMCAEKKTCSDAHNVLDETTNTCVCDSANHWIGNAASCQCEDGYVLIGDACQEIKACTVEHTVWDKSTNTCGCDTAGHWTSEGEACICAEGYVKVGDECQIKRTCDVNRENYDETTNTCSCDSDKGWTGTAGSCTCDEGKVQVGNACETKTECDPLAGQYYIENANICGCDNEKGWIGDGTTCRCMQENYIGVGGVCELKNECNSEEHLALDETTNECVCDLANGWGGEVGSCECTITKDDVCASNSTLVAGDVVKFGNYEWIVLENTSAGVKLLTKGAVDRLQFDSTNNDEPWASSSLRIYLNDTFYNADTNFSAAQRARIQAIELTDVETTDNVFLLGKDEIDSYKDIAGVMSFNDSYWWLRNTHSSWSFLANIINPLKNNKIDTWSKELFAYVRPVVVIK